MATPRALRTMLYLVSALLATLIVFIGPQPAGARQQPTEEELDDQRYQVEAALTDYRRSTGWASNFDGPATGSGSGGIDSTYSIQGIWTEPDDPDGRRQLVVEVVQFESADEASSADMSPWLWWPSSGESVTIGRHAGLFEEHTVQGLSPGQSILVGSVAWICSDYDNLAVVCHGEWTVDSAKAIPGADQMRLVDLAKDVHAKFVDAGICQAAGGSTGGGSGGTSSGGTSSGGASSGGTSSGGSGSSSSGSSGSDSGSDWTWLYYAAPAFAIVLMVALLIMASRRRRVRLAKAAAYPSAVYPAPGGGFAPAAGVPQQQAWRPSPQGMENGWYVQSGGASLGPYPWPAMLDMVHQQVLAPSSLVWHPLTGNWVPAGTIPNLLPLN
jgi:hypothetical protein